MNKIHVGINGFLRNYPKWSKVHPTLFFLPAFFKKGLVAARIISLLFLRILWHPEPFILPFLRFRPLILLSSSLRSQFLIKE